jgi:hypothetical protein
LMGISTLNVERGLQVLGTCGIILIWISVKGRVPRVGIDGATDWIKVLGVRGVCSGTFFRWV